ncbi:MAG: recombinase family protein [Clostridiales bacterium]|jgi:DNA invertase Pin-like site-specific DNA recombinase|nr:recombinase family protein [Clostridiales bacterium]
MEAKRVACFYRVSTTRQLEKDDILMQQQACREFIEQKPGWKLVREYKEKGVSGYKTSAKNRDELQRAKLAAENSVFDVLLVYMFDRLGRKDNETPFIVQYFDSLGVEIWSTLEGQQKFENYADTVMNYIRFWQANSESKKTSQRVTTKWSMGVINYLLRNPIYKGRMAFGKRTNKTGSQHNKAVDEWVLSEQIDELIIVSEKIWDKVQSIRSSRTPEKVRRSDIVRVNVPTAGQLLFVGYIYCGHCGSPLTSTVNNKTWTNKDGTTKRKLRMKYRCSGKALSRTECDGQSIYSKETIEELVLEQISTWLNRVQCADFNSVISQYQERHIEKGETVLKGINKKNEENYEELAVLKNELPRSLVGKSAFTPEVLGEVIKQKEADIEQLNNMIRDLEGQQKADKANIDDIRELKATIHMWQEMFEKST